MKYLDFKILDYIKKNDILSHYSLKNNKKELLEEHIKNTQYFLDNLLNRKIKENIDNNILNFIINIFSLHDVGKINKNYQNYILNNKNETKKEHSVLSYLLLLLTTFDEDIPELFKFISYYSVLKHHSNLKKFYYKKEEIFLLKELKDKFIKNCIEKGQWDFEDKNKFLEFLIDYYKNKFINQDSKFYMLEILLKTFSELNNYIKEEKLIIYLKEKLINYLDYLERMDDKTEEEYNTKEYVLLKYFYSLLTVSDIYATAMFETKKQDEFKTRILNKKNRLNILKENINKILNISNKTDINKLRTKISDIVYNNFIKNKNANVYLLELATGTGKTLTSLRLCNNNFNKIFYVLPYNTILTQVSEILENMGLKKEEDFIVINSLESLSVSENEDENKLKLLENNIYNSKIILTTNVTMFKLLFGNKKNSILNYTNIAGSLLIFDEIQTIKYELYEEFIKTLNYLGDYFNTKSILMSATNPISIIKDIANKYGFENNVVTLFKINEIKDKDLKQEYKNLFEKRVITKYLNKNITYNLEQLDLLNDIKRKILKHNKNKILIEFITKKNAGRFYNKIIKEKKLLDYELLFLSSETNLIKREEIINKINTNDKVILVTTQVIEAGIDIDMDLGFKELGTVESEIQFLGRINRNATKQDCYSYFFKTNISSGNNTISTNIVYDTSLVNFYTIENLDNIDRLQENETINNIYNLFNNRLNNKNKEYEFTNNFDKINNDFKLIKSNNIKIFIPVNIKINNKLKTYKKIKITLENVGRVCKIDFYQENKNYILISYFKFLNFYTEIIHNKNLEFFEKKLLFKNINQILNLFITNIFFNIYTFNKLKIYLKNIDGIDFYILDEKYLKNIYDLNTNLINIDKINKDEELFL